MKQALSQALRRCAVFFPVILFFLALSSVAHAASQPRVLRVGFPQLNGYTTTDEYGVRHGLVVDYLNEIAKYTGWEYEYIDTDGDAMLTEFNEGAYDLIGGAYYMPVLEEYYAYPDYSCGSSKSVLLARWDDTAIRGYDLTDLNGKTIGVHANASENIRRLNEFLSMNGLDCTLKPYRPEDLKADTLDYFLESGEVDLLLGSARDDTGKFRRVASFDAQPHYIVTTPGNREVLDGLNMALSKILESNPNFAQQCYEANFPHSSVTVSLSETELAYIQQRGPVRVAMPRHFHPLFCLDEQSCIHNGIVPDMLEKVSDFSGLAFEYLYTDTYEEALALVRQGKADMAGFFLGNSMDAVDAGLSLTRSYVTLSNLIVRNKSVGYPGSGLTCGVLKDCYIPHNIKYGSVVYYDSVSDALADVNSGKIDFLYGISSLLENDMRQNYFPNIMPVSLFNTDTDFCFALLKPADSSLLTILNKAITNLSDAERSSIASRNMTSFGTVAISLSSLIYSYPIQFACLVTSFVLLLIVIVILVARSRIKATVLRADLEKAEADSKAKSAFLSRMSHEIRTPMNAVIGLAELTCMMENVPQELHNNLSKLQTSSHYLLHLLNDILDMSRIESNMMTLADEPFSLLLLLEQLQNMMDSEAKRKGLSLQTELHVTHTQLSGDVTRLQQVLANLLSNAIKFTPQGEIRFRVTETESDSVRASFLFQVSDSGIGILPEDQKRIFGTFEQAGSSTSRSHGTGLGLPISYNIVKLMGGELQLTSVPGQGSEFYFTVTFPYGKPADEPEQAQSAETLQDTRLLLVEDNELNAEIAKDLLELRGAQITCVVNGQEALDTFSASAPGEFDAVLMDIQMPVMNGLEATRAIRSLDRPDAESIPIVAMTANTFQEDVDAAEAAGMNGFVTKPLDVKYLYSVLEKLLAYKN